MRKGILALSILLIVSTLALVGCKDDEPASEVNEPKVPQPEQPKQTATTPEAEKAALEAAEAWLRIVDSAEYAKSWGEAAEFFRKAVTKDQWESSLAALRKQNGKLVSRKIMSKKFTTTLKNSPQGQYVVIQYQTRFEKKSVAIETITPMFDKDGQWRVSGYYIR